jgi:predicted RNase H-like nuclease/Holliday junction resolvase RusA-like endonuclease
MNGVEAVRSTSVFLGVDLGWTTGATGLAAVDDTGRLTASGRVKTDDEIAEWITAQPGRVVVAAVDAPVIVPNETGQRVPERLIGQAFGGFGASAHTSNHTRFPGGDTRAMRLAQRFGWLVDPGTPTGGDVGVCIEVYPHPALVGLFELPYRLDYKKGNDQGRAPGFRLFAQHLESIPQLALAGSPRWAQLKQTLSAPRPGDLNRVEDELDAIVCAHLAWQWHHRRNALEVYGDVEVGYIVAPPPPLHRPQQPERRGGVAGVPALGRFERVVHGRPTGYSGGANEQRWKADVRSAFSGCSLPTGCRVHVELEFFLGLDQIGPNEPDLDNLIKAAIDALDGVLGVRTGTGLRVEADDVRVDRITASKRPAGADEDTGARITVAEL